MDKEKIKSALDVLVQYGQTDGDHHKAWVIDQAVRCLTGCPIIEKTKLRPDGSSFTYEVMGESEEYKKLIEESYDWDIGCAP